jgi:hypothetical protein
MVLDRRVPWAMVLLLVVLGCVPRVASGQDKGQKLGADPADLPANPRWEWGLELSAVEPVGAFADHVGGTEGFDVFAVLYLGEARRWGVRLDADVISYGSRTVRSSLGSAFPFVEVDMTTDNSIVSVSLGSQLLLGSGRIRPFLHAAAGVSEFVTTTSVRGTAQALPFASTDNYKDHTLQLYGGGGVRVVFREQTRHPIGVQLGGAFAWHGSASYLTEDGLREGPGGTVVVDPIRSDANLATLRLGFTVGYR